MLIELLPVLSQGAKTFTRLPMGLTFAEVLPYETVCRSLPRDSVLNTKQPSTIFDSSCHLLLAQYYGITYQH